MGEFQFALVCGAVSQIGILRKVFPLVISTESLFLILHFADVGWEHLADVIEMKDYMGVVAAIVERGYEFCCVSFGKGNITVQCVFCRHNDAGIRFP